MNWTKYNYSLGTSVTYYIQCSTLWYYIKLVSRKTSKDSKEKEHITFKNIRQGKIEDILNELTKTDLGAHYLVIYPDLVTLRELYSRYIKTALYDKNEIVIVLPFYETADTVRKILAEDGTNIDVRKYERKQLLVIIDSLKGYFGSQEGLMPFVKQTMDYAKTVGKSGVAVFADLGSFFYYGTTKGFILEYEKSLPLIYDGMNLKGFCLYHQKDFDKFSEEQQQKLIEHHGKTLKIAETQYNR